MSHHRVWPTAILGTFLGVGVLTLLLWGGILQAQVHSSGPAAGTAGTTASVVTVSSTSSASSGITPVVSAAVENSHVLKASAGNLYNVYATNFSATPGWLVVVNATTAPADGAITPLDCSPLPANGVAQINYGAGPPATYSTGITALVSSGPNCFTKVTGVITAFFKGGVQ